MTKFIDNIGELLTQPILNTDTYKATHFTFAPDDFTEAYSYIEARKGGEYTFVQWFGLQYILRYFMTQQVTLAMVDEAEAELIAHGVPFNRQLWLDVIEEHNGYLPVEIYALPEGVVVEQGTVLAVVIARGKFSGLAAYIETLLMRVWYPTTIATRSMRWWQLLHRYLEQSGTPDLAEFKMVDFGARGVSSAETAGIGGMAHLLNSQVTDNQLGIRFAKHTYRWDGMPGFSIPATEHAITTTWGKHFPAAPNRDGEFEFFENILSVYGETPNPLGGRYPVSVVIDTYDQDTAVKMWLTPGEHHGLFDKLKASNMCLVLRPDSGDPIINVVHLLNLVESLLPKGEVTINEKGFRVLPDYVRIIQGDGIHEETLRRILQRVVYHKWSVDNLTFGSGGGLLVHAAERDTHRFAMKGSEVVVAGERRAIQKTVATDPSKASKKGRFAVVLPKMSDRLYTIAEQDLDTGERTWLELVYKDGLLCNEQTWPRVRETAQQWRLRFEGK